MRLFGARVFGLLFEIELVGRTKFLIVIKEITYFFAGRKKTQNSLKLFVYYNFFSRIVFEEELTVYKIKQG